MIRKTLAALLLGGALVHSPLHAGEDTVTTAPELESWSSFVAKLGPLEQRMLDKLPERLRADPAIRQRAWRLLLMASARTGIDALVGDRRYPMFVPEINLAINLYQPNADTIYKSALIEPEGTYRITGKRGTILFAKLGQLGPDMIRTGQPSGPLSYLDLDEVADKGGDFSVIISPEKPAGYDGHWWQLDPQAVKLMLRQVGYDWAREEDTRIAIERLDTPAARPAPSAEQMNAALAELPTMIGNAATFFVAHVEKMRNEGYINKLKVYDLTQMSGLTGQSYYEGAYEIADDEALIVSVKVPELCKYWSLILTNDLYETTDWYNNHSSLNGAQARLDSDGYFRAVISAKDPGVHNWLDTAGFASGAIQGRWLECSGAPIPDVQKVALDEVKKHLPADTALVTPAEREDIIRARRAAFQQRRLW
ncbi:MAG: hypothetical protein RBR91_08020 [Porticoccaceae bacterium]|jgi:hypothetical protein|nr:hypothetical protein [Porticoccaceae bacterium]